MNKIYIIILICCLLFTSCNDASIGIIGGSDGPTAVLVTDGDNKTEKEPVKMANINGELYFELDEDNEIKSKCGVMDGNFTNTVGVFEVPGKSGEINFPGAKGYQTGTVKNTVEILLDGEWEIFKKLSTNKDVMKYKYCYTVEGRLNNAKTDSKFLVLADTLNITFEEASYQVLGSDATKMKDIYVLPIAD